jgi:hypothetical protein
MKHILKGRYGPSATLKQESKNRWALRIKSGCCRFGLTEDKQSLSFVDPEGGPFIALGDKLSLLHRKLPPVTITKIDNEEGIGIVITTEPS